MWRGGGAGGGEQACRVFVGGVGGGPVRILWPSMDNASFAPEVATYTGALCTAEPLPAGVLRVRPQIGSAIMFMSKVGNALDARIAPHTSHAHMSHAHMSHVSSSHRSSKWFKQGHSTHGHHRHGHTMQEPAEEVRWTL